MPAIGIGLGIALNAGGAAVQAETSALIARMSTPPSASRIAAIDLLITTLKAASIWSKLDVLQVYAAADQQAALLNWVSTSFNASVVNAPTFTADRGFNGNGTTSYVNTGFKPSLGVAGTVNDCFFGVYDPNPYASVLSDGLIASNVGANQIYFALAGSTSFQGSLHRNTAGAAAFVYNTVFATSQSQGFAAYQRTGATANQFFLTDTTKH